MKKEHYIILILLVFLIWFGMTIVRLENFRYGAVVGSCSSAEYEHYDPEQRIEWYRCLHENTTRTSPLWNLLYGLEIF